VPVVQKQEDDWWVGIVNGVQGVFPSTFVEAISEESDWQEFTTEGGDIYYHNSKTGETSWERPSF
jgi:hypothetical protein